MACIHLKIACVKCWISIRRRIYMELLTAWDGGSLFVVWC